MRTATATTPLAHGDRRLSPARALLAFAVSLPLAACAAHSRDAVADAPAAITTATQLCHWADTGHMHAEIKDEKMWHVWDEEGLHDAYINRHAAGGTFVCVTL